jgi:hypothetical protein
MFYIYKRLSQSVILSRELVKLTWFYSDYHHLYIFYPIQDAVQAIYRVYYYF